MKGKRLLLASFSLLCCNEGLLPQTVNPPGGVLYADRYPGVDVFAKAMSAFRACGWQCTVVTPPTMNGQPYTASSTLAFPPTNGTTSILVRNARGTCITKNAELLGTSTACFPDASSIQSTFFVNYKVASSKALCRNGHANTNATGANVAHFYGDPTNLSKLDFLIREDGEGNLFLSGPASKPCGTWSVPGQWVPSHDGRLSVCLAGIWVQKL